MSGEMDSTSAIGEAERLVSDEDSRLIKVKIFGISFVNLDTHLKMMREMRRRKIQKVAVDEKDEDVLSALEARFRKIFDGVPQREVELDVSRREMRALGRSLPLLSGAIKEAKKLGYPLPPGAEKDFPVMIYQGFVELLDAVIAQSGTDDPELRESLNSWIESLN